MDPSIPATLISLAIPWAAGFAATFLATPLAARLSRKLNMVGVDVHKMSKPKLPEMCGLAIIMGLVCSVGTALAFFPAEQRRFLSFILCVGIAALVGLVDDFKTLGPRLKPLLTVASAFPILFLGTYAPYLTIPFLGTARLTIVYPVLVMIAMPVLTNAINMMNPFNGAMSGTCSVLSIAMIVYLVLLGRASEAVLPSALLGTLLAFHWYNRYPAKVFSGNAGDLAVGAAIGALAIMDRIEVPVLVAMIPHITNAFYLISSVGGLRERREMASRPTRLLDDGRLEATEDREAPMTLSRLILAEGPLHENEIVRIMIILTAVSSVLGMLTLFFLMRG